MHPFSPQYRQWRMQEKRPFLHFPAGGWRMVLGSLSPYTIAMANLGFHTIYRIANRMGDVACERAYLPSFEETEKLKQSRRTLTTLETETPVQDFSLVALSISFESDYLSLPQFLEASGIPLWASERTDADPVLLAGGAAIFLNPEPIADFVDVFALGEGEMLVPILTDCLKKSSSRQALIASLSKQAGFYNPRDWTPEYAPDGSILTYRGLNSVTAPLTVSPPQKSNRLRISRSSIQAEPPHSVILTPESEMGDKLLVEISRGCGGGCRFCWAGYNYLPPRHFAADAILEIAGAFRVHTAKIGLISAAICDHPELTILLRELKRLDYQVSFSSLRLDNLDFSLVTSLLEGGEKTLTLAPEAGTDRLRKVINKGITDEQIIETCDRLFLQGVLNLKCYFMYGLPTETQEDLEGMVGLVRKIRECMFERRRTKRSIGKISVDLHPFVPKPNTPFQWCTMEEERTLKYKMQFLQQQLGRIDNVFLKTESPRLSCLQALLSLGDRRLGAWIARLNGRISEWRRCAAETGIDVNFYLRREKAKEDVLPWDVFSNGLDREFLWGEYRQAREGCLSVPCPNTPGCRRCGVCT